MSINCTLGNNITLTSEWMPMGTASAPYTGIFDGNGRTVLALSSMQAATQRMFAQGFFGGGQRVARRQALVRQGQARKPAAMKELVEKVKM